jgi:hypothetical protein
MLPVYIRMQKISVHLYCVCQSLVFNVINTVVTDIYIEGNIRIDRLPLGPGTDCETDISTGPYHDPWAVCISWYYPPYQ